MSNNLAGRNVYMQDIDEKAFLALAKQHHVTPSWLVQWIQHPATWLSLVTALKHWLIAATCRRVWVWLTLTNDEYTG